MLSSNISLCGVSRNNFENTNRKNKRRGPLAFGSILFRAEMNTREAPLRRGDLPFFLGTNPDKWPEK